MAGGYDPSPISRSTDVGSPSLRYGNLVLLRRWRRGKGELKLQISSLVRPLPRGFVNGYGVDSVCRPLTRDGAVWRDRRHPRDIELTWESSPVP